MPLFEHHDNVQLCSLQTFKWFRAKRVKTFDAGNTVNYVFVIACKVTVGECVCSFRGCRGKAVSM